MRHFLINVDTGRVHLQKQGGGKYGLVDELPAKLAYKVLDSQVLCTEPNGDKVMLVTISGDIGSLAVVDDFRRLNRAAWHAYVCYLVKSVGVQYLNAYKNAEDMPEELKKYMSNVFNKFLGLIHQAMLTGVEGEKSDVADS